ncbi:hypothetical protein FJY71_07000, partial [candidate division WOR-3 bacterium]|nr:hypothetical protein [candidate division WOR-3 bacterium]
VGNDVGYIAGGSSGVRLLKKTTDGGASWTAQSTGQDEALHCVLFPNGPDTGYCGGDDYIFRTTNGGQNWSTSFYRSGYYVYSLDFTSGCRVGYAASFDPEYVLKTTNAGATWTEQHPHISSWINSIDFAPDGQTGYVVGGAGAVSKTTNGGDTWVVMPSPTANNLQAVHFPFSADTGYAVGRYGTILWTTSGGVPGIDEAPGARVRAPNRGATVVRGVLFLPAGGEGRGANGELLDIGGRRTLDLKPGANDVRHLSPGVYFVQLTIDNRQPRIAKVVLAR